MSLYRKEKALVIAIGANILLIAIKFVLANVSGSLALKASAWHSFSDIFVSVIVLSGLFISRWKDKELTKGISKIESYVSIIVSLFIFYIGYEIFQEVILGTQQDLEQVPIVTLGAIFTIAVNYFMARYKIYVGQRSNSPSLIADGYHSKMDMYSSILAVVGLVGYLIGLVNMDKVAAVFIVLLIGWTGLEIFVGAFKSLRGGEFSVGNHNHLLLNRYGQNFRHIKKWTIPILIAIYLASGIYNVRWGQTGIEKRFGKPVLGEISSGIHYRLPWPVGQVDIVNTSEVRTTGSSTSLMLTGDENLIEVNTVAHYSIKNAYNYIFRVKDSEALVLYAIESAVRQVISQTGVDSLLTSGKAKIQGETLHIAQSILDEAQAGIRLISFLLPRVAPPTEVISAFQDVSSAKEDKVTYLNEALSYQNEVLPVSRGKAAEVVSQSESYRDEKINYALGESQNFLARQKEYEKTSEITKTRMYIETLEKILPGVDKIIVDSRVNIETTDLWSLRGKAVGTILKEVR